MEGIALLAGATSVLASLGCLEAYWHRRHRCGIPLRIHVNGTRGKSSVTRLIAAGLRSAGIRTCAKTTGTLPRFIHPDGTEESVERVGRTNVIEQVHIIRRAAQMKADAIVLECMALHPLLQSLCELDIVQATHGVITNARPDHLDVMGPTPADVARALAGTVPVSGTLFTAERDPKQLRILENVAMDRQSKIVPVDDSAIENITAADLQGFSYIEHPDNVALSLQVCQAVGVERSVALAGMWQATPDPGAMSQWTWEQQGRRLVFVNAFAANDPQSTDRIWSLANTMNAQADTRIAVVNCRTDRPDRSIQMAEMCATWNNLDNVLAIGTGTDIFMKRAAGLGVHSSRLHAAERQPADSIINRLRDVAGHMGLVMGLGNIAGVGMELVDLFRNRAANFVQTLQPRKEAA
ncbi:MAG: poly-gamma-glutamate synthase PgsB [Planctomycetaceae bacterium]|nr:poly-gamma-glutamate synthase PgsB [Planctomycetaceae bacterium]